MPIIKSAIKRSKQTKARTARNLATKRSLRAAIKAVDSAVADKNGKAAAEALVTAQSVIDTAAKKNLIHKNKAARMKSRLSASVKSIPGSSPSKKAASAKPAAKKAPAKKTPTKKPATKKAAAKKTTSKKS